MSYPQVTLESLCHKITDGTHHTPTYTENGIPFLRVTDVTGSNDSKKYISKEEHLKLIKRCHPSKNDILYTKNGTIGVGKIVDWEYDFSIFVSLCLLKPKHEFVDVRFMNHFLNSPFALSQAMRHSKEATIKNLHLVEIKKIKIPLPPLPEQQKIAAILDAADQLRQKDQQLIEHYTRLGQSLFLEMFGDPVRNPRGWESIAFNECLDDIIGGKSVGGEERPIRHGEKAVIKISAVTSGVFNSTQYKVVNEADIPEILLHPKRGDLLFSRANTREMVGATCIVDADYENLFLPDKIWRLDLVPAKAGNWYVKFLLTHDGFRENLRKVATGTSGSMLNISKAKLKQLKIPLPSITLQNQFAQHIEAIEQQKQQAQSSLEKSEALFNSLLQRAFKGELTG